MRYMADYIHRDSQMYLLVEMNVEKWHPLKFDNPKTYGEIA